jgi:hypothetical protein
MQGWRYATELGTGIMAYCALLVASILVLRHGVGSDALRDAVAVTPMLGGAAVCWAILRQLRRMDEMWRRVHLDALALAFTGTAFISFTYGFLEGVGFPRLSMFVVWPIMATLWVAGCAVLARRLA